MSLKNSVKNAARRWKKNIQWNQSIGRFYQGIPDSPKPPVGRVLHYVGIGSMYHTPLEILMYHGLRQRGFEVDYYIYGPTPCLNEITTRAVVEGEGLSEFWKRSYSDAAEMLRLGKVNYQLIPESPTAKQLATTPQNLEALTAFEHEGIEFGQIALGCMYRYYKSLTFATDALQVGQGLLETAIRNYECVKHLCSENQYDFVLFSHGIYVTWQCVVEYCRRHQIDFVCYDRAKTRNTANFNANQPSPDWGFPSAWERYRDRTLDESESSWVNDYLQQRETQAGDVYSYNPVGRAKDLESEKERLGIPIDRKVVTIFTNLIWDAANVSRDIAFDNCLDCIIKTITRFADNENIQVVVRSHPAEAVLGTQQQYGHLVKDHFGDALPANVTVVAPDDLVNSFTMIEMTDVGVVNTSTVGLEMAMLDKPVVLISETHYRGKGFTFDAESSEQYFEMLDTLLEQAVLKPSQVDLARKYFYMMMSLYQHLLPTRYDNQGRFSGYSCERFDQLNGDEPIFRILDSLTGGVPADFIDWPERPTGNR